MAHEVEITIRAGAGAGKTTIARYIGQALQKAGIETSVLDIEDDLPFLAEERIARLAVRGTNVLIKTEQVRRGAAPFAHQGD